MEEITVGRLILMIESNQYGRVMYEVIEVDGVCPICGCDDYVTLEIVSDDNVGYEQSYGYHEPNERVDILSKTCMKKLIEELETQKNTFKLIPKSQETWYKENIARNNDY